MCDIITVAHVTAVASGRVNRSPRAKDIGEKLNFTGLQDNVIRIMHDRNLFCIAQIIFDFLQANCCDEFVSRGIRFGLLVKRIKKLVIV